MDFSFVAEEAARCYHPDMGRRSFPPEVLFRALFLEVWANLSDVQVSRDLRYNVLYRRFCGIGWDDEAPDDTTLVVFRRRLGAEVFGRPFARVVEQAKERGLLKGKWAVVDGTKVVAHAAVKNNVALAREGRKRLLKILEKHDADLAEFREFYRKVVQFEGIASLSDPDARWGFKKKDEPFLGYKAHVACDATGVATAARVTPGNESELPQALPMVRDLEEKGLKPLCLAADKGYDDSGLRAALSQEDVRAYIRAGTTLSAWRRRVSGTTRSKGCSPAPAAKERSAGLPTSKAAWCTTSRGTTAKGAASNGSALGSPGRGRGST